MGGLVNNIPTVKQHITGIVVSHAQKIMYKKNDWTPGRIGMDGSHAVKA